MSSRYNSLLADCEGCGHLVKGGASATCDYSLHTGKQRGCPPGKDCLHYVDKQAWEEQNMKRNNGQKIRPMQTPSPVMPPKPQAVATPATIPQIGVKPSEKVSELDTKQNMAIQEADLRPKDQKTERANTEGDRMQMEEKPAMQIVDDYGEAPSGLTVDHLALLLSRCQLAGLGSNAVSINGMPLPDTDTIVALIRQEGIIVELTGMGERGEAECRQKSS